MWGADTVISIIEYGNPVGIGMIEPDTNRVEAMNYPVVIHKDKSSDYGITVPDLPGCFTAGSMAAEALTMAKDAIEVYLEFLLDECQPIPASGSIEKHKDNRDYQGGTRALVSIANR